MCSKEARRTILWMCWVVNMIVTSIYYILSFLTTTNLVKSYKQLDISVSNKIWHAPVAAALLGGLLVLLFNLISCAVLIRKSIEKRGPGLGYGFMVAMCFTLAFFVLLCGLVLDGFRDTVKDDLQKLSGNWSQYNTGAYNGTIAMAYLCFIMFIVFFFALIVFQTAVSEELGIAAVRPQAAFNPYAQMAELPYPAAYGAGQDMAAMKMSLGGMMPMQGMPHQQGVMPQQGGQQVPMGMVPQPPMMMGGMMMGGMHPQASGAQAGNMAGLNADSVV